MCFQRSHLAEFVLIKNTGSRYIQPGFQYNPIHVSINCQQGFLLNPRVLIITDLPQGADNGDGSQPPPPLSDRYHLNLSLSLKQFMGYPRPSTGPDRRLFAVKRGQRLSFFKKALLSSKSKPGLGFKIKNNNLFSIP